MAIKDIFTHNTEAFSYDDHWIGCGYAIPLYDDFNAFGQVANNLTKEKIINLYRRISDGNVPDSIRAGSGTFMNKPGEATLKRRKVLSLSEDK